MVASPQRAPGGPPPGGKGQRSGRPLPDRTSAAPAPAAVTEAAGPDSAPGPGHAPGLAPTGWSVIGKAHQSPRCRAGDITAVAPDNRPDGEGARPASRQLAVGARPDGSANTTALASDRSGRHAAHLACLSPGGARCTRIVTTPPTSSPSDRPARWARGVALGLLAALAACGQPPSLYPPLRLLPAPNLTQTAAPESAASAAERDYYARTQATLLGAGLLRTDGGLGGDAPFDARSLAETFLRLAFYDEYGREGGRLVPSEAATPLSRWAQPVRVSVEFGASVPTERQAAERVRIGSYLARLSRLTGHSVGLAVTRANLVVYIGTIDERRALAPRLTEVLPGLDPALAADAIRMGRANFCLVYVNTDASGTLRERAMAVIPSELPDLMSLMCLQEELAQSLGLGNDSRLARPSIFNDDNEFATLTRMDELMLRMLYSPELRPGMTEAEARPVVESLARRLMEGET